MTICMLTVHEGHFINKWIVFGCFSNYKFMLSFDFSQQICFELTLLGVLILIYSDYSQIIHTMICLSASLRSKALHTLLNARLIVFIRQRCPY